MITKQLLEQRRKEAMKELQFYLENEDSKFTAEEFVKCSGNTIDVQGFDARCEIYITLGEIETYDELIAMS